MKAIVVREPGAVATMNLEEVADPVVGARDVLVKVEACGVCYHEVVTRNGTYRTGVQMPLILGHEISGEVVEVGAEVPSFKPGDRVASAQRYHICGYCTYCRTAREALCGDHKFLGDYGMVGGYAEYVAIEHDNLAHVPAGVPLAEASIAACAIGTVLNAIRDVGRVQVGERVLVTGAGGGLGMHAIQLARQAGAHVVAVTSSPEKSDWMRKLGAHDVVEYRRGEDFSAEVKAVTDGKGCDAVIDNVGSPLFQPVRRSLAPSARWLMVGQLTGDFVPFNPAQLFLKDISLLSVLSTSRKQLVDCLDLMARGQIRPIVNESLPLSAAQEAHRRVEAGSVAGRLLLRPSW